MKALAAILLLIAAASGTLSDVPPDRPPVWMNGYRVIAADFHVHTHPLSAAAIAPWDVVLEARRQGLDAIAVSGHNETMSGKIAHWFSQRVGGPIVLPSEEIHGPRFHMIAVGIRSTISWRLSASEAIDEVHRQGGVAIAAHPVEEMWPAYDAAALAKLDAAEVVQPVIYSNEKRRRELEDFYRRAHVAAIGSTDYHGAGPLGLCRTYVFVRSNSEQEILDAVRAGRTVVLDRGRAYGDPALIEAARRADVPPPSGGWLAVLSRICGIAGLVGVWACAARPHVTGA